LTVVLWRADGEDENIDKAVDFPLECVCPSTLGVQQEGTVENTLYKRFGIVQHQERMGGRGHYTAVTNKDTTDRWHHYNNRDMKISKFQNRRQNKTYIGFQRSVSILFYQCPRSPRCNINDSIMVDTTRCLNNDNGEPTNPSTERTIEHSLQILNAHANTMILDNLRPTKTARPEPTIGPEDSRQRGIDHSGKRIAQEDMPNAQDGVLQNDIIQCNDVVEFHQSSKRNQFTAMVRPRVQTHAEILMPCQHYEAMIRARAAEERNNILWPDSMVIDHTERAVEQSCQLQELNLPTVLNAHANNMAVNSTRHIMDDSILPIPPRVMPQAQDGILHDDILHINDSTECILDHRGEPITQRVMPNAQDGILQNDIRQPIDLSVSNESSDETYVYLSDDQSLYSDSSSADDSQSNAIPPPIAPNEDELFLQNAEGHECTICQDIHHLHDMALGTF
jgi:hypothetical protein